MIRTLLFDRRILLSSTCLLGIVAADHILLQRYFSELDILEHFLFGFVISEVTNRLTKLTGWDRRLFKVMKLSNTHREDFLVRLLGFLVLGVLVWEGLEWAVFPNFGVPYNPFFSFPLTLHNIDGMLDVAVGILGCAVAWVTSRS